MSSKKTKQGYKLVKWYFGKEIQIPEEWEIKSTSEILKITMGQSPSSKSYNEVCEGLPFYQGVTDFGATYPNPTVWCTEPKKIAKENSILFSVRAPVGEINLTKTKCCLGRGVAALNPLENNLWYCYYLLNKNKKNFLIYSSGTTYDAINRNEIDNVKLSCTTNTHEQQKIASILSRVDALIESTQKIIEKTERLKKGLMQKLLTRGIGHDKFKKVKWLFGKEIEIPEEWKYEKLSKNAFVTDGSHLSPKKIENGFPLATVENVNGSELDIESCYQISKEDFDSLVKNNCKPQINDVLFTKDGTVGKSFVFRQNVDVVLLSSIAIIRPKNNLDSNYLHHVLQSRFMKKYLATNVTGTAIKRIILRHLDEFKFPLPPLKEQQKIASILSNIDVQIQAQTQYKEKLERLKKSLMQKLLTGEVRVIV